MINLTRKQYERLKVQNTTINTNEGYLFRDPNNSSRIIKIISSLSWVPEYLKMKMYTIKTLIRNKDTIGEIHIAIPDDLTQIEQVDRGCGETYLQGNELGTSLDNYRIPLETRIDYLKQVGKILRDMENIRRTTHLNNFYYNDIHEGNFIVKPDGTVYGIDIDSCNIEDNIPSIALYPSEISSLAPTCKKYRHCDKACDYATDIIPDKNLDLYCYIRMILNFMYGKPIDNLNEDNLYEYLNFLEFYGGNQELLYCLSRIYDNNLDNINPDYLLDHIKEIYHISNHYYDDTGKLSKVLR